MKGFTRYAKISLAALLTISIVFTSVNAQSATGLLKQSIVTAQDTVPTVRESEALGVLSASLRSLSNQALRDRRIGGYVLLGLGIGSGIGGAAVLVFAEDNDDAAQIVGYSLVGAGVLLSGLSLLPFTIPSESERIYREFSKMPEDTPEQVRQKFHYGDRRFEALANKSRTNRFIGGGIFILSGVINSIIMEGSTADRVATFTGSAIPGVMMLLIKSEEEKSYETYRRAKEDIIGRNGGREIYFGVAPLRRGGILAAVQVRF